MSEQETRFYSFGPFRLDAAEGSLARDGAPVPLTRKAVDVLLVLIREKGRTVGKQELLKKVWPDTAVEDTTIAQNIFTLRKALGKTADGDDYIRNVPRRGYKFTARVEESGGGAASAGGGEWRGGERRAGVAGRPPVKSLAVLPICNETGDPEMDYLSMGITESVINNLSRLPELLVMASSSIFHFKCDSDVPREVGRQLGVRAVLSSRLLKFQKHLIIRTELVDVGSGAQLWGDQFEGNTSCLLEMQDELSKEISMHLSLKLTSADRERLSAHHTLNNKAYQFYLKGRYFWNKQSEEGYEKSIRNYIKTIEIDPDFALAYSGLADSYAMLDFYGILKPKEIMSKAGEAARKAVEVDESLAECHNSLACVEMLYEWDWGGAEHEFRRALSLNPDYAPTHHWYSRHLAAMGRFDESLAENRKAFELDPYDPNSHLHFGCHYFYARMYDQAIDQFRRALELEPDLWPASIFLGQAYTLRGEHDEAIKVLERPAVLKESPLALGFLGFAYGKAREEARARELLARLEAERKRQYVSPYGVALVHAGLGDKEQTFAWLETAYEERNEWLGWLNVTPEFDPLRSDPRYETLVGRLGIKN